MPVFSGGLPRRRPWRVTNSCLKNTFWLVSTISSKPKKILVDAIPFDHGMSGISVYTMQVVCALVRAGHSVTVLVTKDDAASFTGCNVILAPRSAGRPLGSILFHAFKLPKILKKGDYDFCLVTAANRRFPRQCPIPVLGTVHDLAQCRLRGKYDKFRNFYLNHVLARWVRTGATRVIAISKSTMQDIMDFWKVPQERISLIYNGLSLVNEEKPGFLEQYGLEKGKYILYVSRLEYPSKNHLRLIKAFEKLPKELTQEYSLVMVGSPWKNFSVLENYVKNSPLRDRIKFTGFVPSEFMPEAYRSAALYVFPSCYEGFGLSLVEAMHYGCPCCCSNNSSLGEIGKDAALLFSPYHTDAIYKAILTILENKDNIREKLIEAGHKREEQFDWNHHAAEIVRAFEQAKAKANFN